MAVLNIQLKQHTPIIHFQHYQEGATLRASELKPKLDKFLIEKLKLTAVDDRGRIVPKREYLKWFNNKEKLSLDYKVKIESDSVSLNGISDNKTYFGNMGDKKENKQYMWSDKPIKLSIFVFDQLLENELKKYLAEFFAENNFGTRQNKGNGSFYIDESDQKYKPIENVLPKNVYFLSIKVTDNNSIFRIIDYYYKRLKSGINFNFDNKCKAEYQKSYLYKYFNAQTTKGWEKRFIKEEFFGLYKDNIKKYFIRALLGLPGNFMFKKTKEPCHKKNDKKINFSYEISDDYDIEVYHPEIDRYKSPITFKPIKYKDNTKIFVLPQVIDQIKTSKKILLYKKFVLKKIQMNNGKFRIVQKTLPERLGTKESIINSYIADLTKQENNIEKYLNNIQPKDNKGKDKLRKLVDNYIKGQKGRFEKYLKECSKINGDYLPPYKEIELPQINLELSDLLIKYNEDELKRKFTFEGIEATIDNVK